MAHRSLWGDKIEETISELKKHQAIHMSNTRLTNCLDLEQIATMNPHDFHMFIESIMEQVRNIPPRVSFPVFIEEHETPFTIESNLYREGTDESRYRLYQFIKDLEAFARFVRLIDPLHTVGNPVVSDNQVTYKIIERPNNRIS